MILDDKVRDCLKEECIECSQWLDYCKDKIWHTETPTEEGWYLFSYKHLDTIRYGTDCFLDGKWVFNPALDEKILAWQKIDEYKGDNNG